MDRIASILDAAPVLKGRGSFIWVYAKNRPEIEAERPGAYQRGHIVDVTPDTHCPAVSGLPTFVRLWVPLVSVGVIKERYTSMLWDVLEPERLNHKRRFRIQWDELPAGAKQQVIGSGALIIKAGAAYTGPYDYTWEQVRGFIKDNLMDTREDMDIG